MSALLLPNKQRRETTDLQPKVQADTESSQEIKRRLECTASYGEAEIQRSDALCIQHAPSGIDMSKAWEHVFYRYVQTLVARQRKLPVLQLHLTKEVLLSLMRRREYTLEEDPSAYMGFLQQ